MPAWEDADERLYEERHTAEGFDSLVDRLMACDGLDRDEAEREAKWTLENSSDKRAASQPGQEGPRSPTATGGGSDDQAPGMGARTPAPPPAASLREGRE